jgi:hypothetical protein
MVHTSEEALEWIKESNEALYRKIRLKAILGEAEYLEEFEPETIKAAAKKAQHEGQFKHNLEYITITDMLSKSLAEAHRQQKEWIERLKEHERIQKEFEEKQAKKKETWHDHQKKLQYLNRRRK